MGRESLLSDSKALNKAINVLATSYKSIEDPSFVQTGSLVFDALLGGGIPKGNFILLTSASGIGKSTAALYVSLSYCVQGLKVLYLDFEGGVNENQLKGIGVYPYLYDEKRNPNGSFYCYRAHTFIDAEKFIKATLGMVDLVVIDSVTAMLPEKLLKEGKTVEDVTPGITSRIMSVLMQKFKAQSMRQGTSWLMINQTRTKIRFVGQSTDEEAGGNALKFYSDYRIMMKKSFKGDLMRKEETPNGIVDVPYGSINAIWCVKSRHTRPYIPLRLAVIYGKGISNVNAYLDYLLYLKKVKKKKDNSYVVCLDGTPPIELKTEARVLEWIKDNKDLVRDFMNSLGGYKMLLDGNGTSALESYLLEEDAEEDGELLNVDKETGEIYMTDPDDSESVLETGY